ncbi:alpha/beta hydrolase [Mycolicibacterium sp. (ex Dasyatis americana)]|nr:alpha/beta hydrolase [Mycolicibacterium sp. (ex Dasyatis americana)]
MIAESRARFGGVGTRVLSVPGNGTPVMLLHGYADSADTWRAVLTRLEALGRNAIAVDLPGFGRADRRRPGPLLPQFDAFADALLADHGPAILVGNSLGAATAVRAATRNPGSVRGLVALDDPLNARHWLARAARYRDLPVRFWNGVGRIPVPATAVRWAARRSVVRVLYGSPTIEPDPVVMTHWATICASQASVAALGRYAFQYARETRGGHRDVRVTCPTVVVHGARDRIIPVDASHLLHQQIPGSELVVLTRSGHCPQLDDPDAVVRLITAIGAAA